MSITIAGKKITLDEEGISEILVADTDSESGSEASDFENNFEDEEEEGDQQQQQASAIIETQAATSGGLPTWRPPQGRNTNVHPFVGPAKGVKKSEAPHIKKDSSPLSVLMFFAEIFHLLVEQTNVSYQQHLDRQAGPSRRLPDVTLPELRIVCILQKIRRDLTKAKNMTDYGN